MLPVLEKDYVETGKVKFVFHPYAILGADSVAAAEAAECAADLGRFMDYHDRLYYALLTGDPGGFSRDSLKRYAADVKLPAAEFAACVDSRRNAEKVVLEYNAAVARGVYSTPTVFVNGLRIEWRGLVEDYSAAIERALAEAR